MSVSVEEAQKWVGKDARINASRTGVWDVKVLGCDEEWLYVQIIRLVKDTQMSRPKQYDVGSRAPRRLILMNSIGPIPNA